jgi:hypothetical protein
MKKFVLIAFATAYCFLLNSQSLEIFQDNGRYGVKDKAGVVLSCEYDKIDKLGDNLFAVYKNNECGIFNPKNKNKVEFNYKKIVAVSQDRYIVQDDTLFGLMDREGNMVVKPTYNDLSGVNFNKARFRTNKYFGVIDLNGKEILPATFSNIFILKNGFIIKKKDNSNWSYITDPKNTDAATSEFEDVKEADREYEIKKNGKWGVMSDAGEMVADCAYDSPFSFGGLTSAETYLDGKQVTISKVKFFGLQNDECYVSFWTASNMVKYDKPITVKVYNYPLGTLLNTLVIREKSLARPDCAAESKNRIKLDKMKYQFAIEFDGIISQKRDLDLTNESNCKIVELR